ncbi:MAG: MFS transporter [Verrucomicrobiota bacterium]
MNPGTPVQPVPIGSLRWWLCGLLFAATALSFLDRQVLSVLAPVISKQLGMSSPEYARVTTAFLLSYAVMFLVGGRVLDFVGTRLGLALSVGIWSLASALHAVVQNATQLGLARCLLGAGEGGCFPGAAKGVGEWFPPRERAMAMGVAIGGASLGAVVAPPLTVWLAGILGWRWVFVTTGLIGAIWVATWWLLSRRLSGLPPAQNSHAPLETPPLTPRRGEEETRHLASTATEAGESSARPTLAMLMRRLDFWGLAAVRFIVDPVFYFYMFWIPKYLSQERGASQEQIGELSWIPFLALGISNVAGGWGSDALVRRGWPALTARRMIMGVAALLTIASSFAGQVGSVNLALGMMALLMFAHGFWVTNYVTLISERFPQGAVGTVMGFSGAIGAVGGMLANLAIGSIVDRFSYGPVWLVSGCMYPLAFGVLLLTIKAQTASTHASAKGGLKP